MLWQNAHQLGDCCEIVVVEALGGETNRVRPKNLGLGDIFEIRTKRNRVLGRIENHVEAKLHILNGDWLAIVKRRALAKGKRKLFSVF